MAERETYLTQEGRTRFEQELRELVQERRPQALEELRLANEAQLFDDGEYQNAKETQALVEARIRELEEILASVKPVERTDTPYDSVKPGCTVVVLDQAGARHRFGIVGRSEADSSKGRISNESPVGRALIGRKAGDRVQVKVPSGIATYTVEQVI